MDYKMLPMKTGVPFPLVGRDGDWEETDSLFSPPAHLLINKFLGLAR